MTKARIYNCGLGVIGLVALVAGCGVAHAEMARPSTLKCDASMIEQFKPDALTRVILVEKVQKGAPFPNRLMEQFVYPKVPTAYGADLCHVKLLVGPGNPGPADAPSTSRGIGIEVWLPEKAVWNGRVHAIGGSGATGSQELAPDKISQWTGAIDTRSAPRVAAEEGAVTSTTDSGRGNDQSDSSWMYPDGTINFTALNDWNYQSLYEQAVKTKLLATAYYGSAPKHSYFDGASGGGRQAFQVAQKLPEQYDGIVTGVPALAFAETMSHSYAGLVILRDLGGKAPTGAQLDLVTNAAIAACDVVGGRHLGFVLDNATCRYDPTKDPAVLCAADGGENRTPACVSRPVALAINKIWYGPTRDGSVPDPVADNGWDRPIGGNRVWYGIPRGTDLKGWATVHSVFGMDVTALVLGNPKLASLTFKNATGNGEDAWKGFTYEQFAAAFDRTRAAQPMLQISANATDLAALKASGAKFLVFPHLNDAVLPPQPDMDYYRREVAHMGGAAALRRYFRMYFVPGLGHGPHNGTANPMANPPADDRGQLYGYLVNWVERGTEPTKIVFTTATHENNALDPFPNAPRPQVSLPVCEFPALPRYVKGDIFQSTSYTCR